MRLFRTIAFLGVVAMATRCPVAAADPAPIRHLEYHISGHTTAMGQGAGYGGTMSGIAAAGYDGTMSVDVLALAKDGGMVVRAQITMREQVRPEEAVTCAVYGDGRVICPQDAPVTGSMSVLFAHLGRDFYDPTIIDTNGKWTRTHDGQDVAATSTFIATATQDPNIVTIKEHTTIKPRADIGIGYSNDTDIRYNVALSVPVSIHDVATPDNRSNSIGLQITDLALTSDSFAKH